MTEFGGGVTPTGQWRLAQDGGRTRNGAGVGLSAG